MMSTELPPQDDPSTLSPPEIDEGYWSALLEEGEYSGGKRISYSENGVWEDFGPGADGLVGSNGVPFGNQHDWVLAQETYEADKSIELVITGYNRGGLLVSWNSLRGFVPASQLVNFPVDIDETTRRSMLSKRIGEQIGLRIIELEVATNRLILSERAAQAQPGQRADILSNLEAGTVCEGVVTNLCDFGAFVDLGGIEGLIHISELSWGRVNHPRDVLSSGQQVKAYIMSVEPGEERIALSLKRLQPDPWQTVEERYDVGQIVEGVVTNVVDFGAFACIEEGLEGLIHISELAEGQFLHPRNVVAEGEHIQARILNIDGRARRLGLSLRHLQGENEDYPTNIYNVENSSNSNHNHPGSP